jgi:hyaluronoglucosaminidase
VTRGFADRGIKGWAWTVDQYLDVIPSLAELGLTFLMNCYASLADIEHQRWGTPGCNRWWEPLPLAKRRGFESIVALTQAHRLEFWFSMNPNLFAERIASVEDGPGLDALWAHYAWIQSLGVRTFSVALDDIGRGVDPRGQARLVNELLRRLRVTDPAVRMVFCPTIYWGDGSDAAQRAYLEPLAATLDPAVELFWTGQTVVGPTISADVAARYRAAVDGRRLVVWDNYPCNDDAATLHLGPLTGRDPRLAEVAIGYLSNPMARQHRLSLLAIATAAEYAAAPDAYDPAAAIRRAVAWVGRTHEERAALSELTELYPGDASLAVDQYANPIRDRVRWLVGRGDSAAAEALARRLDAAVERFRRTSGERFPAELAILEGDVAWARAAVG